MLPPAVSVDTTWALVVAVIYFGSFMALGIAARMAVKWLMSRVGVDLEDVHAQAGPNRRSRKVFLLGSWRTED